MRPFTLLIKPAGPDCNLDCSYCFYAHKAGLFEPGRHRMSDNVLDTMIRDYLKLALPMSAFAWQGGEPTLMGLGFFERVVELQKQHGRGSQHVSNALQTNGVLLDTNWARFLHEYQFLVGISLDGPGELHDAYRLDHSGRGTFDRVMASIENCRAHKVEFNILVLLNDKNVKKPDELFDFFVEQEFAFVQFIPCVERDPQTGGSAACAVRPEEFGEFMCRVFDRWLEHGPGKMSVRLFDSVLSYCLTGRHTNCTFGERCDDYIVIEHNGDAFCCDFFVTEQWRLGNLMETPVAELFESDKKRQFSRLKRKVANQCIVCRHHAICRGGCLKDRIALTDDYHTPSYLCEGYKQFFEYSQPRLLELAAELRQG